MPRIRVQPEVCSGCRACMVACVVHHDGLFGTATARIYVAKDDAAGTDEPRVCHHCRRAPCVAACPSGALYRDEALGLVRVRAQDCTGCGDCVAACPFGAIALHPQTGTALLCDLCGGDPACVKRCATGAIEYAV
jgi:carbon-monoxide dehydrogenase iron sulfur subunit